MDGIGAIAVAVDGVNADVTAGNREAEADKSVGTVL